MAQAFFPNGSAFDRECKSYHENLRASQMIRRGRATMKLEWWVATTAYIRSKLLWRGSEEGQGLVEYSLILAFIMLVVWVSLKFIQPSISTSLNNVANGL